MSASRVTRNTASGVGALRAVERSSGRAAATCQRAARPTAATGKPCARNTRRAQFSIPSARPDSASDTAPSLTRLLLLRSQILQLQWIPVANQSADRPSTAGLTRPPPASCCLHCGFDNDDWWACYSIIRNSLPTAPSARSAAPYSRTGWRNSNHKYALLRCLLKYH